MTAPATAPPEMAAEVQPMDVGATVGVSEQGPSTPSDKAIDTLHTKPKQASKDVIEHPLPGDVVWEDDSDQIRAGPAVQQASASPQNTAKTRQGSTIGGEFSELFVYLFETVTLCGCTYRCEMLPWRLV